jgi:hypothetical protein
MPAARRPHMSKTVKLQAALNALGLKGYEIEWNHIPALGLRDRDPETGAYIPDANDPDFIVPMIKEAHRAMTNGIGGTCADGDIHKIWKARRIAKDAPGGEEFRRKLLAPIPREERPRSKWPKRKFQSRKKT